MSHNHGVVNDGLDRLFALLSDPTRRMILRQLHRGSSRIKELAARSPLTQQSISKHVDRLVRAGLVERQRVGREQHCRLVEGALRPAIEWLRLTETDDPHEGDSE